MLHSITLVATAEAAAVRMCEMTAPSIISKNNKYIENVTFYLPFLYTERKFKAGVHFQPTSKLETNPFDHEALSYDSA